MTKEKDKNSPSDAPAESKWTTLAPGQWLAGKALPKYIAGLMAASGRPLLNMPDSLKIAMAAGYKEKECEQAWSFVFKAPPYVVRDSIEQAIEAFGIKKRQYHLIACESGMPVSHKNSLAWHPSSEICEQGSLPIGKPVEWHLIVNTEAIAHKLKKKLKETVPSHTISNLSS